MKKYIIYSILLFAGVFQSCELEEDVDPSVLLKEETELISINSTISPQDEIIKVQVVKSISINQLSRLSKSSAISSDIDRLVEDAESILNAEVLMNEENKTPVKLNFSEDDFGYVVSADQLPILAGKRYFLQVQLDGKTYTSNCTIPKSKLDESAIEGTFIKRKGFDGTEFTSRDLKMSVNDIKGEENYYVFGGKTSENDVYEFDPFENNSEQFISDNLLDGSKITTVAYFKSTFNSVGSSSAGSSTTTIQVANVEKILFDALRLEFSNRDNLGDPFVEQAILPTNIKGENAVGIFAGYQITNKEIPTEF